MPEIKATPENLGQDGVIKIGVTGSPVSIDSDKPKPPTAITPMASMPTLNSTEKSVVSENSTEKSVVSENNQSFNNEQGPVVVNSAVSKAKISSVFNNSQNPSVASPSTVETKAPDIYAMPKEFQHHNRVAGTNSPLVGILVILGGLLFLVVVGGGFFMYVFNPGLLSSLTGQFIGGTDAPTLSAPGNLASTTPVVTPAATTSPDVIAPSESPQVVYFKFLKELSNINTFEDYYILVSKYGNGRKISAVESERLLAETTPEADKASVKAIKEKSPGITDSTEASSVKEEIIGQTSLLSISLPDGKTTGTVAFTLENNVWKIGDENWSLVSATPDNLQYTRGEDRDSDGLTDKEEDLLGSNKDSTDTDKDGYNDLSETLNLYNPSGNNKLVDNTSIKSYLAENKSFYLLYPSKWVRTFNSKDQSVIFRSSDDHFIQLMIDNNDKNVDLDEYVKEMLSLTTIKDSWRRTGDAWQGIVTEDGLQIYIMGTKQDKVYILRYSPSDNNVLEYLNVFQAMIKSFVIKK